MNIMHNVSEYKDTRKEGKLKKKILRSTTEGTM